MKNASDPQSGNVLWFILLAVALLGFLTIVVTRSGSSVEQSGNVEQTRVKAAALLRYGKSVETAVAQMIATGISESDLDFSAIDANHTNANCTDDSCKVFQLGGGGINYLTPAQALGDTSFTQSWVVSEGNRIGGLGCDDADDSCRDLVLLVSGIADDLCKQINSIMKIENPSSAPPTQANLDDDTPFTGAFTGNGSNFLLGGSAATASPQLRGKSAGCVTQTSDSSNYFIQVLLAR